MYSGASSAMRAQARCSSSPRKPLAADGDARAVGHHDRRGRFAREVVDPRRVRRRTALGCDDQPGVGPIVEVAQDRAPSAPVRAPVVSTTNEWSPPAVHSSPGRSQSTGSPGRHLDSAMATIYKVPGNSDRNESGLGRGPSLEQFGPHRGVGQHQTRGRRRRATRRQRPGCQHTGEVVCRAIGQLRAADPTV